MNNCDCCALYNAKKFPQLRRERQHTDLQRISVSGTVHLILVDGFTLTAPKGINVSDGNSLTIYGQANSTGTLTISGVDESDAGIGSGYDGYDMTITLSWTNDVSDSIYASSYGGTVTISKGFILDGTEKPALLSNIDGNKIVASSKVHALKADARLALNAWEYEGVIITLSYDLPGYDNTVFSVNGTAIEGNIFEMPASGVTLTLTPITYTITYSLNGGSADTPETYTVESTDFTLNNPTRTGFTFTGWTGTSLNESTLTVTIAQGSTGNRSYSAVWNEGGYTPTHSTEPEFVYHHLILSGQLDMMFYVYIPKLRGRQNPDTLTQSFRIS